jgi:hypothetical protein
MNKDTIEDIIRDCPCADKNLWCFLKEVIRHSGISDFSAEQIRLVYTHKFLLSLEAGHDVGEKAAWDSWIQNYAEKYREIYHPGDKHEYLKYKMFIEHNDVNTK